ncbi:putative spore protein YtfJ [Symbiobacterium terraclitae]|jgi:uncharacterized spore protein YtfJ|uniref:Spore protein YtfJ n=1 Tax=Symbiobacterium terraclitae TaxID=557451 RepID=A0ABS4JN61_9FIRM|nr:spore germination protein GerW family protein [Symbiobacterium terraclitae]MBP2016960.1 putative spore protein YtfJ [Symbiobacterium terraclitae]
MAVEIMDSVIAALEKHLSTKTVVGEPITMGSVTLIPVVDLMFGFGAGGGEGRDEKQGGSGSGGGAGARLSARAVIVVRDGDVSVLPLGKGGAIDRIVEAIPGLVEKIGSIKGKEKSEDGKAEE